MLKAAYAQLLKETLQWLQEQPSGTFVFGDASDVSLCIGTSPTLVQEEKSPLRFSAAPPLSFPVSSVHKRASKDVADLREVPQSTPMREKKGSPTMPSHFPVTEIRKILQKIAPSFRLSDSILDDAPAQRIASAWKEKIPDVQVVLLALDTRAETIEFLKNLGKAVQTLAPVKIMTGTRLEQEKRWDLFLEKNAFRLIIASEGMPQYPELVRHYRALPARAEAFLGATPLVALSAPSVYLQSPEQKALLWKKICHILKS